MFSGRIFGHTAAIVAVSAVLVSPAKAESLRFEELEVPTGPEEKADITTSGHIILKGGKKQKINYHRILESGQTVGEDKTVFGLLMNNEEKPLLYFDGGKTPDGRKKVAISHKADYASLIQKDGRLFSVTHFEHGPAALYLSEITETDGKFRAVSTRHLDTSDLGGIWYPCAGVVTGWQTHLGAEEFPIDARFFQTALSGDEKFHKKYHIPNFRYFHQFRVTDPATHPPASVIEQNFNPYRHGYVFEVAVDAAPGRRANAKIKKHYAMGRFSHEVAYVMPDRKTVYMSDDDGDGKGGFFMFVADEPEDFSAGVLYAARWRLDPGNSRQGTGAGAIAWISLGRSNTQDLKDISDAIHKRNRGRGIRFDEIFDATDPVDKQCAAPSFASNQSTWSNEKRGECLKRNEAVSDVIASRLETRRYALIKGATLEFSKAEGLAYDPEGRRLFMTIAQIIKGMTATDRNWRPKSEGAGNREHIALTPNPCGAVYALDIAPDAQLGSEYVARTMYALISGKPKTYPRTSPYRNNACDIDAIAGPDNLTFLPAYRLLVISEDTDHHENNAVWAFNVENRELTRIQSMPKGGEATSVYYHRDIAGKGYIVSVLQHPGRTAETGETFQGETLEVPATVGLIGPLPVPAASE